MFDGKNTLPIFSQACARRIQDELQKNGQLRIDQLCLDKLAYPSRLGKDKDLIPFEIDTYHDEANCWIRTGQMFGKQL